MNYRLFELSILPSPFMRTFECFLNKYILAKIHKNVKKGSCFDDKISIKYLNLKFFSNLHDFPLCVGKQKKAKLNKVDFVFSPKKLQAHLLVA